MINEALVRAYNATQDLVRFDNPTLPTNAYHDTVGTHIISLDVLTDSFRHSYPRPNNLNWRLVKTDVIYHDWPEVFGGDQVVYLKSHKPEDELEGVRNACRKLGWDMARTNSIVEFEETTMRLNGRLPLHKCRREHLLVATFDLISAANVFHLESVRARHIPEYSHYFPLPNKALLYAPRNLINYARRLPLLCNDQIFIRHLTNEIDKALSLINGWWSAVKPGEISPAMKLMLQIATEEIQIRKPLPTSL